MKRKVDCANCKYNLLSPKQHGKPPMRHCSKGIKGFPNPQGFCFAFKEIKESVMTQVTVVTPPAPVVVKPNRHEGVHLKQYADKKKKDVLFSYIFLPKVIV